MNLLDAYDLFIGEYENRHTVRSYRNTLIPMVRWLGIGKDISEVEVVDLLRYVQSLKKGEVRGFNGEKITLKSRHSVYKHIKSIKSFFNFFKKIKMIAESPASDLANPRPDSRVPEHKALSKREIEKMLRVADGNPRNFAITCFLRDTGCRAGELATLKINDIDWVKKTAIVTGKFNKSRPVWFSDETAAAIKAWLVYRPVCDHNHVFAKVNDGYGPMSPDAVSGVVRRLAKKAKIKRPIGSHAFRHALGFAMADNGTSPTIGAVVLGHKDASITMAHYFPHDHARAEAAVRDLHEKQPRVAMQDNIETIRKDA